MNIGSLMRGLLGDSRPGEVKAVELKEGQVVRGTVLSVAENGKEAVVQIQGTPVRAELETPLAPGQMLTLQVAPAGENGLPVLKPVPAETALLSSPQSMGEALETLGLSQSKAGREVIQAMLSAGLPLTKETAAKLDAVMAAKPQGVPAGEWLESAAISLKRGLPVTTESVKGIQQAVFGPKLHELLTNLENELRLWTEQTAKGSSGTSASAAGTGVPAGTAGAGEKASVPSSQAQAASGNVAGAGTADSGPEASALRPGTVNAHAAAPAVPGVGTGSSAQLAAGQSEAPDGLPQADGKPGMTSAGAALPAADGAEGLPQGTAGRTEPAPGAVPGAASGAEPAEPAAQAASGKAAGTPAAPQGPVGQAEGSAGLMPESAGRAEGPAGSMQGSAGRAEGQAGSSPGTAAPAGAPQPPEGRGGDTAAAAAKPAASGQAEAVSLPAGAVAKAAPAAGGPAALQLRLQGVLDELRGALPQLAGASPAPAAGEAADPAPAAAQGNASTHEAEPWVGRVLKLLGAEHEQQAVRGGGETAAQVRSAAPAAAAGTREAALPQAALQGRGAQAEAADTLKGVLLQVLGAPEVPPAVKEAAGQLVQQLTGQQLLLNTDRTAPFAQVTLFLPLRGADGEETASVHIQSRRGRKGELDPANCRLWFDLDMRQLGQTLVDVQVVDRIVSLKLHNDTPWVLELLEARREDIQGAVESIGYQLSSLRTEPLPERSTAPSVTGAPGKLADYVPDAYKGVDYRI
ncbi:hypothetical protein [Paenibacillus tengchongensis]|uniref:hypothetical protein n=1 Tax=Paenibacillus tengchongensis TaxID=2608684 RepID=UPI00124E9086|nr:hypothetical protein [Paenibacillus tengchongensis]